MSWSLRIAKIAGIGVQIHWTFLLLIAWVVGVRLAAGATALQAFLTVVFVFALFACVVLHELGHALTARRFGIPTRDITLLPIGGVARLERMPDKPMQEFLVAIAGPAVNVAIALLLLPVVLATVNLDQLPQPGEDGAAFSLTGGLFALNLMVVNVMLVVFNAIPAFPMDGGRVLRALLSMTMDRITATQIAARLGQAFAILFGIAAIFINPLLLIIAIFVFLGAEAEAHQTQVRSLLRGVGVRDAMVTRFRTISPRQPLRDAIDALLSGAQTDFPVIERGELVGMLRRDSIVRAAAENRHDAPIEEVMEESPGQAHPGDSLSSVFQRMHGNEASTIPVVDPNGELVGLVTLENVGEWMMIHNAARRGGRGS